MSAAQRLDQPTPPQKNEFGYFVQIPLTMFRHLEGLSPLARKTYLAVTDLTKNRPWWEICSASVAAHIAELYQEPPAHKDSVRRALKLLQRKGLLSVLDTDRGTNRYRIRLAGQHSDGPKIPGVEVKNESGQTGNPYSATTDGANSAPQYGPLRGSLEITFVPPRESSSGVAATKAVRSPRIKLVRSRRISSDPHIARSPYPIKTNPPSPRSESAAQQSEGGGNEIDRIVAAWKTCGGKRPVTEQTAKSAVRKAVGVNSLMQRETIVDHLVAHAEVTVIPKSINEPLMWVAGFDLTDKPQGCRRYSVFPRDDRPLRIITIGGSEATQEHETVPTQTNESQTPVEVWLHEKLADATSDEERRSLQLQALEMFS